MQFPDSKQGSIVQVTQLFRQKGFKFSLSDARLCKALVRRLMDTLGVSRYYQH